MEAEAVLIQMFRLGNSDPNVMPSMNCQCASLLASNNIRSIIIIIIK